MIFETRGGQTTAHGANVAHGLFWYGLCAKNGIYIVKEWRKGKRIIFQGR